MTYDFTKKQDIVASILKQVSRLPSLPANVGRILKLLRSRGASATEIGAEIAKDQSLSVESLRLVNSGFYGVKRNITSIQQATVLLGFNVMSNLVLSSSAGKLLQVAFPGLYDHSLACSKACYILSENLNIGEPEELSASGLLHDIGKMVFCVHLKDDFAKINDLLKCNRILFKDAADEVMMINQIDIAYYLLTKWNLPEQIIIPVCNFYNFDSNSDYCESSAVLHLANIIVRAEGFGFAGDLCIPPLQPEVMDILKLNEKMLRDIMDHIADNVFELQEEMKVKQ